MKKEQKCHFEQIIEQDPVTKRFEDMRAEVMEYLHDSANRFTFKEYETIMEKLNFVTKLALLIREAELAIDDKAAARRAFEAFLLIACLKAGTPSEIFPVFTPCPEPTPLFANRPKCSIEKNNK